MTKRRLKLALVLAGIAGAVHGQTNVTALSLLLPPQAKPNQLVQALASIRNTGATKLTGVQAILVFSVDEIVAKNDVVLARLRIPTLGPGATYVWRTTIRYPNDIPARTCAVGLIVDPENKIRESRESDNAKAAAVACSGLPDLIVASVRVQRPLFRGRRYDFRLVAKNDGGVASATCVAGFWLSADNRIDSSDLRLASESIGGLAPKATLEKIYSVEIPGQYRLGQCYVIAYVDSTGRIAEGKESNNSHVAERQCRHWGFVRSFGTGCSGSNGVPTQQATAIDADWPAPGVLVRFALSNGPKNHIGLFVLGFSNDRWGATQLPLRLDAIGAGGCSLWISPDLPIPVGLNDTGAGVAELRVPPSDAIVGHSLFSQFLGIDETANALGVSFSGGVQLRIGSN